MGILRNTLWQTEPVIAHCNGIGAAGTGVWIFSKLRELCKRKHLPATCSSEGIAVITYSTKKEQTALEECCGLLGVPLRTIRAEKPFSPGTPEKLEISIQYLKEHIHELPDLVLFLDAFDCWIVDDLQRIRHHYFEREESGVRAIFGGEWQSYPSCSLSANLERVVYVKSDHPYLNAGTWVARKEYALDLLFRARKYLDLFLPFHGNACNTDQFGHRMCFLERWPQVEIDARSRIFQTLYRPSYIEVVE